MTTVADHLAEALAAHGVTQVWGVVGDALNPVTDAIRRQDGLDWVGVRHEEVGAFAAGAQAQLTGRLGVCAGTVGPGSVHLLNGLYDAKKSHAPVLAICGQVPRADIGSDLFQEVDNHVLFADVAEYRATVTDPTQLAHVLEQAGNAALASGGVSVVILPGDLGDLELPEGTPPTRWAALPAPPAPAAEPLAEAAAAIEDASRVTMLVGIGARDARDDVLALGRRLRAPMVLSLKAKEGLEHDNELEVGQTGQLGNPAAAQALEDCDLLLMVGTDFPYTDYLPHGTTTVQLDARAAHVGRRTPVAHAVVGDAGESLRALLAVVAERDDSGHLDRARSSYDAWREEQRRLGEPGASANGVRPEVLAAAIDRHAASDAVMTTDTGMATIWASRHATMGAGRRLLGSYNLGSMANAMPQALGAAAAAPGRQAVAWCGDGGLTMLLGDLLTVAEQDLPVKMVVFDNGRLGLVKIEQEHSDLTEHGTGLDNHDLAAVARAVGVHAVRVSTDAEVDDAVREAFARPGPVLLDVLTDPGATAED
ncbi:thiamine pyrophosphate-dependent enzyme [uncultured Nocardioides sp.]|uniref:thiamine pyrophosphate-dependent enzyme n=1 Tax=uncultured Nocardioides sp. TaxID=198441 RepID=UPI00260C61B1|nr:thiamine pyrophosphate-dependent enzyme [uncultured Nocardioides sp.]